MTDRDYFKEARKAEKDGNFDLAIQLYLLENKKIIKNFKKVDAVLGKPNHRHHLDWLILRNEFNEAAINTFKLISRGEQAYKRGNVEAAVIYYKLASVTYRSLFYPKPKSIIKQHSNYSIH